MNKLYQNKNWLYQKYWNEELSTKQIAKEANVYNTIISYWMKIFDIPRRTKSKAAHLAKANHCQLSKKAIEWIEGELWGDGCLQSRSKYSAFFSYGSKYWEYINYIADTLKSFGIRQTGKICKRWIHNNNTLFPNEFFYVSKCYAELKPIYDRWYPNGKKIVPRDLELTPLTLRQEFIGDGSLIHSKKQNPYIILATYSFPIEDVRRLVKELNKLGFKATRQPHDNSICISTYSTPDFLNYIGKCPCSVYDYKWRLKSGE